MPPLPLAELRTRPTRVDYALLALGMAWVVSAVALGINQIALHGSGIGPGPELGLLSLAIQAVAIVLVARGSPIARLLVAAFLVLATLPLPMVGHLVAQHSLLAAGYLLAGFILKCVATVLLFTGDANRWFGRPR